MDDDLAIVLFVFVACVLALFAVALLAVPVGIASHVVWRLLTFGWGLV